MEHGACCHYETDLRTVWATITVNLKQGVVWLFEWTKDFNLHTQHNTHAQVWIRLMALPQEYWMDRMLREIASALGTPLLIDNAMTKRINGYYARILIDMDFSKKNFHEITVEREGYTFDVGVACDGFRTSVHIAKTLVTKLPLVGGCILGKTIMHTRKKLPKVRNRFRQRSNIGFQLKLILLVSVPPWPLQHPSKMLSP
jgi:hypothetical protein